MKKAEKLIVNKFFRIYPPCHAIPRANEAIALRKIMLKPPILDLGCGDGLFSLFAFGRNKITVGLDKNCTETAKALKSGVYEKVVVSDGAKLPFKDEFFNSVIANSVLEHVDNLDKVLLEIRRVLKKNGRLVLTVPDLLVSDYQFWSKLIPGYAKFKEKIWKHINYFGKKSWLYKLRSADFKLVFESRINSKQAIMFADIFFPFFFLGPMKRLVSFFDKNKVFDQSGKGATFLFVAKRK